MDLETYLKQDSSVSYYVEDITFNVEKEKGLGNFQAHIFMVRPA